MRQTFEGVYDSDAGRHGGDVCGRLYEREKGGTEWKEKGTIEYLCDYF